MRKMQTLWVATYETLTHTVNERWAYAHAVFNSKREAREVLNRDYIRNVKYHKVEVER